MLALKIKSFLTHGGVLLAGSAIVSKFLGIWRDRLFSTAFGQTDVLDAIFTAFRVPDFFFYLLISGTIGTLLIPRMHKDIQENNQLLSAFFWKFIPWFGLLCLIGIFTSPILAELVGKGLSPEEQSIVAYLSRFIFGSVFLLAIAATLSSHLQKQERFIGLALAPIIYTLSICLGVFYGSGQFGITSIGIGVLGGAFLYTLIIGVHFWLQKGHLHLTLTPPTSWNNIWSDFGRRVVNNSIFQINQTLDVFMAGFLLAGAVGAFTLGTSLGNILLSIIGLAIANSLFPKLTKAQKDHKAQKSILLSGLFWIWICCIPVSIIGALFAQPLVELIYGLSGKTAEMTATVFFWTVLSLPATCSIPTLSRVFLANGDTKTPLRISLFSITCATIVAATLTFIVLPKDIQILGLALGNLTASTLSFLLFFFFFLRQTPNNA